MSERTVSTGTLKKITQENALTVKTSGNVFLYSIEKNEDESRTETVIRNGHPIEYAYSQNGDSDVFSTLSGNSTIKEFTYSDDRIIGASYGTFPDMISVAYGYGATGKVNIVETASTDLTEAYSYTYETDGKISGVSSSVSYRLGANPTQTINTNQAYSYDSHGQLISSQNENEKWEYTYDTYGNILSKSRFSATHIDNNNNVVYNSTADETHTYTYDSTWHDRLIAFDSQSIGSYEGGNPESYRGYSLGWTAGRLMASYGSNIYRYNEEGIRTFKGIYNAATDDFTFVQYYLDGTRIIEQRVGNIPMHFFYDRNDEVFAFEYGSQIYYYTKNLQGDITGIINDEDILICRYEYDDWGKCTVISNGYTLNDVANVNPFRYRSYYYDTETGLYYLQSRYYDPETGRFINCDDPNYIGLNDTAISWNGFAYCGNEPVGNSDPSGMIAVSTCIIIGVAAGALIGGTVGGVISYKKYKSVSWKYIFIGAVAGAAIGGAAGYAIGLAIGASATTAATAKAFSTTFKVSSKISKQMSKRGWTKSLIKSTIKKNVGRKAFNKATGNAATAYFTSSGAYVVIDNVTKGIVQISDINDPNWVIDATIKLLKSDVFIK